MINKIINISDLKIKKIHYTMYTKEKHYESRVREKKLEMSFHRYTG